MLEPEVKVTINIRTPKKLKIFINQTVKFYSHQPPISGQIATSIYFLQIERQTTRSFKVIDYKGQKVVLPVCFFDELNFYSLNLKNSFLIFRFLDLHMPYPG